ncbi:MAG: NAD-dependent epimerase/dehydratase family protein [Gemmatimonadota bacterium]
MTRVAFVTGATGVVGRPLVRLLLARGYTVRTLARDVQDPLLPDGVEPVPGDLTTPAALDRGAGGADVIFHLAALLHINNPDAELTARYEAVNVEGTAHLLEAARAHATARFVFLSTINVYGSGHGAAPFTESELPRPQTPYARTKAAAERLVLANSGGTVLRLAAVYGPGMRGNYRNLAKLLARGLPIMPGDGRNRRTLVHRDDAASAALLAAEHPAAKGGVFNVTDGAIHRFDEIARAIQAAAGRREGLFYLPISSIRRGLGFVPGLSGVHVLLNKLTEDMAVDGNRITEELGFRARYDLRSGWRHTISCLTHD